MRRSIFPTTFSLAFLLASSLAQPQTCTVSAAPSPDYLRMMQEMESRLKAKPRALGKLKKMMMLTANTAWVCSKDNRACCVNIPMKVEPYGASRTSCDALVTFPYNELRIVRDNGNFQPKLSWKLNPTNVKSTYQFGSSGIETVLIEGSTPPVETSGSDKCKYDGSPDSFRCKANGKKDAKAYHQSNVYPVQHLDDPDYRCDDIDPLIHNVD